MGDFIISFALSNHNRLSETEIASKLFWLYSTIETQYIYWLHFLEPDLKILDSCDDRS